VRDHHVWLLLVYYLSSDGVLSEVGLHHGLLGTGMDNEKTSVSLRPVGEVEVVDVEDVVYEPTANMVS